MPSSHIIIAIDGPAASGKGTLARNLARELGFAYLDTGALYRCVGMAVLQAGGDAGNEDDAVAAAKSLAKNLKAEDTHNPALRTDIVGQAASMVAKFPGVRQALFDFQRDFAKKIPDNQKDRLVSGVILDGRDIGTVICPDADVKLFVTAGVEVRTQRRLLELQQKGIEADYETVLREMKQRDARDSERDTAPLKPAEDAAILDTSTLSADEALSKALSLIRDRIA